MRNPNGEMNRELITVDRAIRSKLRKKKHVLILADEFSIAPELTADKQHLWTDWDDLELDNYLKDGGSFRQRRFSPLDSIMVWDPHVMHGVTPIHQENPSESAKRDVLVIGYNHRPDLKRPVGKWGCI